MPSLFDYLDSSQETNHSWVPEAPPQLDNIVDIQLNFETTGLRWWKDDEAIGLTLGLPDGTIKYYPWGHRGGGNLDEAIMSRWAQTELRGKRITNINTRFDVHFGYKWNVDLEAQGCVVSDVAHYAALLDDHRKRFALDILAKDYLGSVEVPRLDESRLYQYHAGVVAPRAEYNISLVKQLREKMWPQLTEQGLQKIRCLEDSIIYVVCEMERNGTKIDIDLLDRWIKGIARELHMCYMEIYRVTGLRVNPDSSKDMEKLFKYLKLPLQFTDGGRPSFTAAIMKTIDNPVVKLIFRAGKLTDIQSKLKTYASSVDRSTGILRYALHQLRAQKDDLDQGSSGTVSGRFSGTKISRNPQEGINIQAVTKPEKQRVQFGFDEDDTDHDDELYLIRRLHISESGPHLSSDAMQIEYRLFAHETKSPRLLDIYKQDPMASFHRKVHAMLKPSRPDLTYRRCKDTNFAKIYGAGLRKMGLMLEFYGREHYMQLLQMKNWYEDPLIKEVQKINDAYNKEIPEVRDLIAKSQEIAKNRGYIKSLLGRRSRFPNGERSHKGLNTRIQPSAADIMKVKMVELHRERKYTNFLLRWTVHDSVEGDAREGKETARRVAEILNHQTFPLRVPILWETSLGPSWGSQNKLKEDEFSQAHEVDPNRGDHPLS